jgi:ATP-dependent RNA helicase SUPV3L1/SUV3
MRARVERRLLAHAKDLVLGLLSPLKFADEPSAPLRGLLYQLEQGLGTASRRDTAKLVRTLPPEERAQLLRAQIYVGQDSVFARPMLSSAHLILRRALARLSDPALDAIKSALEEVAAVSGVPSLARESALRLGFVPLGKWLLRCDVLELLRVARKECSEDRELALRVQLLLGSEPEATAQIVRALGTTASKRARHA